MPPEAAPEKRGNRNRIAQWPCHERVAKTLRRTSSIGAAAEGDLMRANTGIRSMHRSVSISSHHSLSIQSDILPANYIQSIRLYFIYLYFYARAFGGNLSAELAIYSIISFILCFQRTYCTVFTIINVGFNHL